MRIVLKDPIKVMLIYPPFTQPISSKKRCLVPLGIAYVGGYLRKRGVDVELLDCVVEGYDNDVIDEERETRTFGLPPEEIRKRIKSFGPDFVGVSCLMTTQRHNALMVCRIVKEIDHKTHTVMGGCHPSSLPDEVLQHREVDTVVVGEGEEAMYQIVKNRLKGVVSTPTSIDDIPFPARDLLPIEKYIDINMPENIFSPNNRITQITTSRGCNFGCVFCSTTNFHGRWRGFPADRVIEEITWLKLTFDIDEVNILDENFVIDKERAIKILRGIGALGISWSNPGGIWIQGLDEELLIEMKKAGCYQLTLPVESSNERILRDVIHKPLDIKKVEEVVRMCRKLHIDTHAFFVCGFPEQTKEDLIADFKFAKKMRFDSASFHILTPLPGSKLYPKYKDLVDLDRLNYIRATVPHPTLTNGQINDLVNSFNVRFNRSLVWRHPIKFIKKYVIIGRKRGLKEVFRRV